LNYARILKKPAEQNFTLLDLKFILLELI